MTKLTVEKLGGLAGFGSPNSRLKSDGSVAMNDLSDADRAAVERLLGGDKKADAGQMRDGFRYRLSVEREGRSHSVEVPESIVPESVAKVAKDRIK